MKSDISRTFKLLRKTKSPRNSAATHKAKLIYGLVQKYLDPRDKIMIAKTCKGAKQIVENNGIHDTIVIDQHMSTKECLKIIHKNFASLKRLVMKFVINPHEILRMIQIPKIVEIYGSRVNSCAFARVLSDESRYSTHPVRVLFEACSFTSPGIGIFQDRLKICIVN